MYNKDIETKCIILIVGGSILDYLHVSNFASSSWICRFDLGTNYLSDTKIGTNYTKVNHRKKKE